uniref:Uncharacterized protein n=1 Tax=Chromera velia CCMP2878 TaxID=1169474 RepID=A0A0G4HJ67_9ALVE|eukprot:Cvel_1080.t1-p1 / transcript=Cvel_1080.t1 / gene=Cvel_1080 / organism=Chromera_velia_CCMP2878 / gene_product=hypothetical protein / transcript_product=hypothetical protein / location=Cvel_scaffold35:50256-53218(-) / protein_length=542 / sequence_SO=supercontig / SO=protein_coding / is_pseudo=false
MEKKEKAPGKSKSDKDKAGHSHEKKSSGIIAAGTKGASKLLGRLFGGGHQSHQGKADAGGKGDGEEVVGAERVSAVQVDAPPEAPQESDLPPPVSSSQPPPDGVAEGSSREVTGGGDGQDRGEQQVTVQTSIEEKEREREKPGAGTGGHSHGLPSSFHQQHANLKQRDQELFALLQRRLRSRFGVEERAAFEMFSNVDLTHQGPQLVSRQQMELVDPKAQQQMELDASLEDLRWCCTRVPPFAVIFEGWEPVMPKPRSKKENVEEGGGEEKENISSGSLDRGEEKEKEGGGEEDSSKRESVVKRTSESQEEGRPPPASPSAEGPLSEGAVEGQRQRGGNSETSPAALSAPAGSPSSSSSRPARGSHGARLSQGSAKEEGEEGKGKEEEYTLPDSPRRLQLPSWLQKMEDKIASGQSSIPHYDFGTPSGGEKNPYAVHMSMRTLPPDVLWKDDRAREQALAAVRAEKQRQIDEEEKEAAGGGAKTAASASPVSPFGGSQSPPFAAEAAKGRPEGKREKASAGGSGGGAGSGRHDPEPETPEGI